MEDKLIVHISGPSGSGKSTLGNKLKNHFKDKIIVKDLDELLDDYFAAQFGTDSTHNLGDVNEESYQEYINNYIKEQSKPIVFVGLNDNFVDFYPTRKDIYYDVYAKNKYYIHIDDDVIVQQKCTRFLENVKKDTNMMDKIITDNEKFIEDMIIAINTECNKEFIMKWNNKWKDYYRSHGYRFMDREDIYEDVKNMLQQNLNKGGRKKSKKNDRKYKSRKTKRVYKKKNS